MSSEQNPLSLHIMDAFVNLDRAWAYLNEARPASVVWFNNHGAAQECKRLYPWMHVVHRQYHPDDQQWHFVTTPEEWYAQHKVFGANGVIVQCYNEPAGPFRDNAGYRNAVVNFMLGAWRLGARDGVAIGGPAFSMGNPHESRIEDGSFDALIREACTNPYAWMLFHEYWHTDPVAEYPWTIGRHEFWYDRAEAIGLKLTRVLLTEYGMDKGGGKQDGFNNQGVSPAEYAQQHIRSRLKLERKPPANTFGFGDGWGWGSFNCNHEDFLNTVSSYRETVNEEEKPVEYTWKQGTVISTRSPYGTNIRTAHRISNETLTGMILMRDTDVEYDDLSPDRIEEDGYLWWPIRWNGQVRRVAVWNVANQHWVCEIKGEVTEPTPPLQWRMPVDIDGYVITANFGEPRDYDGDGIKDDQHEGIDFAPAWLVPDNIIVSAMAEGVVEGVRDFEQAQREGKLTSSYGCYVRIRSKDGAQEYVHWYAHLSLPLVKVGNVVSAGSPIGVVGSTGNSSGNHVHITIQAPGKGQTMGGLANVIDPATLLSELA